MAKRYEVRIKGNADIKKSNGTSTKINIDEIFEVNSLTAAHSFNDKNILEQWVRNKYPNSVPNRSSLRSSFKEIKEDKKRKSNLGKEESSSGGSWGIFAIFKPIWWIFKLIRWIFRLIF